MGEGRAAHVAEAERLSGSGGDRRIAGKQGEGMDLLGAGTGMGAVLAGEGDRRFVPAPPADDQAVGVRVMRKGDQVGRRGLGKGVAFAQQIDLHLVWVSSLKTFSRGSCQNSVK